MWKLKWNDFLISPKINSINRVAVKGEQTKAALTAALSDDTLKWLNGQGFDPDELWKAEFIIQKIEEYIQGTTMRSGQGDKHDGLVCNHDCCSQSRRC
jgi:hypothetical protein